MTELHELSATETMSALRAREVSSRELVEAHLARIASVNGPINAVVTVDAEGALTRAAEADARIAEGGELPPLLGLPMTHKDTHMVAGMRSTMGSLALADNIPDADDLVIARLRAAGVVATGKNNVPEFGAGSHTFNEVFGTTTNPYATDRSAGGSSGGLAAAVAARIQPLGEGSDMGGSLRIPAAFCNVIGFRPSYGVIPMPSAGNPWAWLGRTGPMAREIDDIALFMSAVSGPAPLMQTPAPIGAADFRGPVRGDLTGVRVGWSRDFGLGIPMEPEVVAALEAQLQVFVDAGAIVEEATPDFSEADLVFQSARAIDFATGLGPLVDAHPDLIKPEVIWNVGLARAMTATDLIAATAARGRLEASVQRFFARYDVFVSPTAQVVPFDAELRYPAEVAGVVSETYLDWMRSACVLSATSLPVLAMPAGFTENGLPVGIQLAVNHHRDVDLLRYAKAFEERTRFADRAPCGPGTLSP